MEKTIVTWRYGKIRVNVRSIHRDCVYVVLAPTVWLASEKCYAIEEGYILVRRKDRYAIYSSLEKARHAYREARKTSGGELRELTGSISHADLLVGLVSRATHAKHPNREFVVGIERLSESLSGKRDENKVGAREHLEAASSPLDSRGRRNPGRQRMLIAQAGIKFEKRVAAIMCMSGRIQEWLAAICAYYEFVLATLWLAKGKLEKSCNRLETVGETPLLPSEKFELIKLIDYLIERFSEIDVQPLLPHRDFTIGDLMKARGAIRRGEYSAARLSLKRALVGTRLTIAHIRLANIREDVVVNCGLEKKSSKQAGEIRLCENELKRLRRFEENLNELDDSELSVSSLPLVRSRVAEAITHLTGGSFSEAAKCIGLALDNL